jgi:hypothetical protein
MLHYKGKQYLFSQELCLDDESVELERVARSSFLGLCVMLHFCPHRPRKYTMEASRMSNNVIGTNPRCQRVPFHQEALQAVGKLFRRLQVKLSSSVGEELHEEGLEVEGKDDEIGFTYESFDMSPPKTNIEEDTNIMSDNETRITQNDGIDSDRIAMFDEDYFLLKLYSCKLGLGKNEDFESPNRFSSARSDSSFKTCSS